jgi:hypothetical protein
MKELFINVISNGDYSLRDMLKKINERHINNDLTDEEKVELEEMARNNAKAINDYAPIEERLEEAFRRIEALESKVKTLEGTETDEPVEGEEVVVEEYPEYVQPLGAHDAYKIGDKVTFNGKKYVSLIDGNNWTPSVYPAGWEEVVEVKEVE